MMHVDFKQHTALFHKIPTSQKKRIKPLSVILDLSGVAATTFTDILRQRAVTRGIWYKSCSNIRINDNPASVKSACGG